MEALSIGSVFANTARRFPDLTAVVDGDCRISYRDLAADSRRRAGTMLGRHGLSPGDRVGVLCHNGVDFLANMLACAQAGLPAVMLNTHLVASEVAYILNNSGVGLLVYGLDLAELAHAAAEAAGLPAAAVVSTKELGRNKGEEPPAVHVDPEALFYLGYTSGTTGLPKGAMVSHRNRVLAAVLWAAEFGVGAGHHHLAAGPLYHTAPFTFALLHLLLGGTVVTLKYYDPEVALHLMQDESITNSFMAPVLQGRLLAAARNLGVVLRSLQVLVAGGSPFAAETRLAVMEWFGDIVHVFYGATETGVITNLRPRYQRVKPHSAGTPIATTGVKVLDQETGEPVPSNTSGLIYIQSPTMCSGYWQNAAADAEVFRDGWLTLDDIGYLDEDGYCYFVDRAKDMIISGGVNVYPREVEVVLESHPQVQEVAVIGVPDAAWGEAIKAVVVPKPGAAPEQAALLAYCTGRLAGFKKPKSVEIVRELPHNAAGKLLRRRLRDAYRQGPAQNS